MKKLTKSDLLEILNKKIIGQDNAKEALVNALLLHDHKITYDLMYRYNDNSEYISKPPVNTLILGPSGVGKTFLAKTLADISGLPFVSINASDITPEGWHGISLKEHIIQGLKGQEKNLYRDRAIIFIDEIDKLLSSGSDHVKGHNKYVLDTMLKVLEGEKSQARVPEGVREKFEQLNTSNMMFVLSGNFAEIREERDNAKNPMGFNRTKEEQEKDLIQELIEYGFKEEFLGRILYFAELEPLSRRQIMDIMFKSNASTYKYHKDLAFVSGTDFQLSYSQIKNVVLKCEEHKLGARTLNNEIDKIAIENLNNVCTKPTSRDILKEKPRR